MVSRGSFEDVCEAFGVLQNAGSFAVFWILADLGLGFGFELRVWDWHLTWRGHGQALRL